MGKPCKTPRKEQLFTSGTSVTTYTYSRKKLVAKVLPLEVRELIDQLLIKCGSQHLETWIVLVNSYEHGKDQVTWHRDDEKSIDQDQPIVSVSLGATRRFDVHRDKGLTYAGIELSHGDVITMLPGAQKCMRHRIPPNKKVCDQRWNLTIRFLNKTL
jgi:alkylated DNA repair dioxygenase AlkB